MAKIEPANLLLTDKDGNTGLVKSLTNKDITTLKNVVTNVNYIKDFVNANGGSLPVQGDLKLTATDAAGKNGKILLGTSSGTLQWNGKNIVRSVNWVNADENGNVQLGNLGAITGEIKWFAFNTPPNGYLVCNGASVSRETYADLFAVIGTTFGSGDGSTTFALPNLINKFAQGSTTVGTYKSAGLPNITGQVTGGKNINSSGAFKYISAASSFYNPPGNNNNFGQFSFDASRSSSIYGNSTTVQPPALTLLPCIKY